MLMDNDSNYARAPFLHRIVRAIQQCVGPECEDWSMLRFIAAYYDYQRMARDPRNEDEYRYAQAFKDQELPLI